MRKMIIPEDDIIKKLNINDILERLDKARDRMKIVIELLGETFEELNESERHYERKMEMELIEIDNKLENRKFQRR